MAKRKTTAAEKRAALGLANTMAVAFGGVAVPTENGAAVVAASTNKDDGLTIPPFLVRKDAKRLTNAEAANLAGARQRDWAPIRTKGEVTKRESLASIMTKVDAATVDKALPVSVQAVVKGKQGSEVVNKYDNWEAYEKGHDAKTYPVKRIAQMDGTTIVIVTAKPWADQRKSTYGHDSDGTRVAAQADSSPATKAQRGPQPKKGDAWADSILSACAKGATRSQVIAFLTAAYPSTDPQNFHNVMYGTLERMVKADKLTKEKGPDGVVYRVVQ